MGDVRLLVCGDRNWVDRGSISKLIDGLHQSVGIAVLIEGEARGADTMARQAAEKLGIEVLEFPANWAKHGKAAGPIRNRQMIKEGKPDVVIAFHHNLNESRGTKDMVMRARKAKIPVFVFPDQCEP